MKTIVNKVRTWILHPSVFISTLNNHGLLSWMSDKKNIKMIYKIHTGKELNLNPPKTFNEKMQWLKLYNRKNIYTTMADKYEVKKYVSSLIGDKYIIPTLAVWNNSEEIDLSVLPDKFVIKCNHGSGFNWICKDKSTLDIDALKKKTKKWMRTSGFWFGREWPYKNVNRRIFAEQFMENPGIDTLTVYKVFCFNGTPKLIQVIQDDKAVSETIDYFDCDWNLLDLYQDHPNSDLHLDKPQNLNQMIELSALLSKDIPYVRVDWYEVKDKLFFSEFTFFSDSGFANFNPDSWDLYLGNLINLGDNIKKQ